MTFFIKAYSNHVMPFFPSQIVPEPDPPTIIEGEENYDVEEVLQSRWKTYGRSKRLEFLVKWC